MHVHQLTALAFQLINYRTLGRGADCAFDIEDLLRSATTNSFQTHVYHGPSPKPLSHDQGLEKWHSNHERISKSIAEWGEILRPGNVRDRQRILSFELL